MDLTPLMKPKSIAVVGASPRMNRATRVVDNLKRFGYAGRVFPINPKYAEIGGLPCYPDLAATPEPADTVVVAIPAAHVPGLLSHAAEHGMRSAVVLSSGFAEAGASGRERQAVLERLAAERGFAICGPNCYGVFNIRLASAAFSADLLPPLRPGPVAVVSQSGGFSHAIAEYVMKERHVGISYIVSCGNQAGVSVEDYVEFLVDDEDTRVIGVFVEGFRQPAKLRQAAMRARELGKTIVVLKVGESENARQAMLAHTGSLAGTPEIIRAVLNQSGIVQVESLNEMIDTLALMPALARHRRSGWRVAVLSGLGGECGRVSDVAARVGVELPPLSNSSIEAIAGFTPDFANPRNPLDGTGAMYENPVLFPRLFDVLLHDDAIDVIAVNLRANVPRPGASAPSREFGRAMSEKLRGGTDRLVLAFSSFAGGDLDPEVVGTLSEVGVPFLEGAETAMLALRHAREHRRFLERPVATVEVAVGARALAASPLSDRGSHGPRALPNAEAMQLLGDFSIPLAPTVFAPTADAAADASERLGYPVVLKVDSPDIVHKTDVGGVRVGCESAASVRDAFDQIVQDVRRHAPAAAIHGVIVQPMIRGGTEMIVGIKTDPLFGPAIVCGFGGIFTEVLRDVAVRVPPIDHAEALAMIDELRGNRLLHSARGRPPADVHALAETLVSVARLADARRGQLAALDLNPVLVLDEPHGVVAVDWLVELA